MHRAAAVVGSVLFLVVAPGTLAVLVPFWISGWRVAPPLVGFVGFRALGALLVAAGLPVLLDGQALFFGDVRLLEYGLGVWAFFHFWVLALEEPGLRAKFGAEYLDFCAHVRRWIPRLKPWRGPS